MVSRRVKARPLSSTKPRSSGNAAFGAEGTELVRHTFSHRQNPARCLTSKARRANAIGKPSFLNGPITMHRTKRLISHSLRFMRQALEAAGAHDIWDEDDDTCHLNGTARMGDDPTNSVVNADCRSWDIPNLWICDGSVFPTVGGVNPSLTIQAIACRTADRIKAMARSGEL